MRLALPVFIQSLCQLTKPYLLTHDAYSQTDSMDLRTVADILCMVNGLHSFFVLHIQKTKYWQNINHWLAEFNSLDNMYDTAEWMHCDGIQAVIIKMLIA